MSSQSYRGWLSFGAGGVIAAISETNEFQNETKVSYSRECSGRSNSGAGASVNRPKVMICCYYRFSKCSSLASFWLPQNAILVTSQ
jgi:hypothetical protein